MQARWDEPASGERSYQECWGLPEAEQVVPRDSMAPPGGLGVKRTRRLKLASLVVVAALVLAAWWTVVPSRPDHAMSVPLTGNLRLLSPGRSAPLALIYGSEVGLAVMRVPTSGRPRVIPINADDRELRLISLGFAPLAIQADIAGPRGIQSFSATGRVITVLQSEQVTGVQVRF